MPDFDHIPSSDEHPTPQEDASTDSYSEETRFDVIRSLSYGQTAEEIAACNDLLTAEAIAAITAQYAAELAEEQEYRARMEE